MNIKRKINKLGMINAQLEKEKKRELEKVFHLNKVIIEKQNNIEQMKAYLKEYSVTKQLGKTINAPGLIQNRLDFIAYIQSIQVMEAKAIEQYIKEKEQVSMIVKKWDVKIKAVKGMIDKIQKTVAIRQEKKLMQEIEQISLLVQGE